jgi:Family of unknown function (DUF6516)
MDKRKKPKKYKKVVDDMIMLPVKEGNGILKYSVSVDNKGKIARYSLSYINPHLCTIDNGRVLGFDNCHGYHHRHYMGKEENVNFNTYDEIAERFEKEWRILHERTKKQNNY